MTGYEAALRLLADTLTPYVWDKLFRASLFDDVRFAVDIKRAEDALVVLETLTRARTLIVITDPLYDYTVDAGGLTWGHITPVDESDRLVSAMTLASRRMRDGARVRRALATSTTLTYLNNAQQVMASNGFGTTSDLEAYRRRISWSDVARALRARPTVGAAALLFKMNHRLYRFLYRAYVERAYGIASSDAPLGERAPTARGLRSPHGRCERDSASSSSIRRLRMEISSTSLRRSSSAREASTLSCNETSIITMPATKNARFNGTLTPSAPARRLSSPGNSDTMVVPTTMTTHHVA